MGFIYNGKWISVLVHYNHMLFSAITLFLNDGSVFTSIMPESQETLMASMTVMGVSMGAYIGLPPSIAEIYGTDIKKMYMANHIPEYFAVLSLFLSAFIHLMIMSGLIYILSPLLFDATCPIHPVLYFVMLILFVLVSLSIACILGLAVHNQAKLTMVSQSSFYHPSFYLVLCFLFLYYLLFRNHWKTLSSYMGLSITD